MTADRRVDPNGPAARSVDPRALTQVGRSVEKVDALGLARGRPAYTGDFPLPNMLHAKILPSPHAHARIVRIDDSAALAAPGVRCVLHAWNVPRVMHTTAGQGFPEPSPYDAALFDRKVRYVGDKVAAVAAETEDQAFDALTKIKVDYEPLPHVFDPEEALRAGAPTLHDEADFVGVLGSAPARNLACEIEVEIPDAGALALALTGCAAVVEGRFETPYAQHCALEPHVTISRLDRTDRLVLLTSTQVPWHARRIVARILGIPEGRIRVIKPRVGGGFGGKQEVITEAVAGLVTLRTGRPCRLALARYEEFTIARGRHPQIVSMRIGASKDGTIRAIEQEILETAGAYGSHALTVLTNAGSKALPLYNKAAAVRFRGRAAYVNLPGAGAYRGYGATQAVFATESLLDELADRIGIDPCELRLRNHIRAGEGSPVFAALGEGGPGAPQAVATVGLDACIRLGAERFGWREGRAAPRGDGPRRRGVGMCALMQGSGVPHLDMAAASIKMNEDGSFNLLVGATDIGTGADTVLAQIAAEALSTTVDRIVVRSSDTDLTPFDVGAYASSTTYVSGGAVLRAAERLRGEILALAAEMWGVDASGLSTRDGAAVSADGARRLPYEKIGLHALYGAGLRQPIATASFSSPVSPPPFAAHFAEVEVDVETGAVRVLRYVAATDCGVAVNPRLAAGQVEGAVLNGLSFALTEEYLFDRNGRVANATLSDYRIFSTRDVPPIEALFVETVEPTGPYGAKSVGEIGINGPMPAVANAIAHAAGVRLRRPPFTPERVLAALASKPG